MPTPTPVTTTVPGDKSIAIRALLLALLAARPSRVVGVPPSRITEATLGALRALGAIVDVIDVVDVGHDGDVTVAGRPGWTVVVSPPGTLVADATIDCGGSATLARLLLGLLAGRGIAATITGSPMLRRRPMNRVAEPLQALWGRDVVVTTDGCLPAQILPGPPPPSHQHITPGNSAQVRASVMLAAVAANVPVTVWSPLPGRRHTEELLRELGADVVEDDPDPTTGRLRRTLITPRPIEAVNVTVPADPSAAAFLWAVAAVGARPLRIDNVVVDDERDGFLVALARLGAGVTRTNIVVACGRTTATVTVHPAALTGLALAAHEVPDLIDEVPILAALCTRARSPSTLHGLAELRVKESDRLARIMELLGAFGAIARLVDDDSLRIEPATLRVPQTPITTDHDHRVGMTAHVLAGFAAGSVHDGADATANLDDANCVDESWPGFVEQLTAVRRALG